MYIKCYISSCGLIPTLIFNANKNIYLYVFAAFFSLFSKVFMNLSFEHKQVAYKTPSCI